MKIKLIYPAFLADELHAAEATVEARLTPKQIIIDKQYGPKDITYVNGHTSGPIGIGPRKWWRAYGHMINKPSCRTWQLAPGEVERLAKL